MNIKYQHKTYLKKNIQKNIIYLIHVQYNNSNISSSHVCLCLYENVMFHIFGNIV